MTADATLVECAGDNRRAVPMAITLRTFADSDLDALFTWESDPRAVQMAAFTRANPADRSAFDAPLRARPQRPVKHAAGDRRRRGICRDGRQLHDAGGTGGHVLDRTGAMGSRARVAGPSCVPCDRVDQTALWSRGQYCKRGGNEKTAFCSGSLSGRCRARTSDLLLVRQALSQLS